MNTYAIRLVAAADQAIAFTIRLRANSHAQARCLAYLALPWRLWPEFRAIAWCRVD